VSNGGTILIVDDNPDILIAAKLLLKKHYACVLTTESPFSIENTLKTEQVDVILLDMNFTQDSISGREGFYWLKKIVEFDSSIAVLLMTAYGDIQLAVEAIKAGAADFVAKPWQNEQLLGAVAAAYAHAKDKQQLSQLTRQTQGLSQLLSHGSGQPFVFLGQSQAMQTVFDTIAKAAKSDANILITGESGTGKELTAHAIHQASLRANNPFVSLDMGTLSDNLFASELFGHKKGAFTDAKTDRIGRFELAHTGSLFLDELGNLALNQQVKLLAAIQNRQITPVGSNKPLDVDIRLICATNDNLEQAVAEGHFRQDLLFRINTVEIRLPPLRARVDDIPLLAAHYLTYYGQKYKRQLTIRDADMAKLCQYHWPGNVRELAHAIERAVILSDGAHLDIQQVIALQPSPPCDNSAFSISASSELVGYDTFDLEVLEQRAVRAALKHFQGNVSHAAKALGLTRGAMYRRLEKYGL
jgi:DNA-binding NtrC family response regulator